MSIRHDPIACARTDAPPRVPARRHAWRWAGLGLSDLLRGAGPPVGRRLGPDTSVILFWMWGGPSQLETYDCKPDAPSEYRGPLRPIRTTVPGLDICEVFPLQAKLGHRISLVRSLHHQMSSHNDGSIELLTGKTPAKEDPTSTAKSDHPDFGMVASRLRGTAAERAAALRRHSAGAVHDAADLPGHDALGLRRGRSVGARISSPPNLSLDAGIDGARLDDRRGLVAQLDRYRRGLDLHGAVEATDQFREQAFQLLTSPAVAEAFDLDKEKPDTRDRYGRHLWGQSCLLARRLAEAGASVITIDALSPVPTNPIYFSWDDHSTRRPAGTWKGPCAGGRRSWTRGSRR